MGREDQQGSSKRQPSRMHTQAARNATSGMMTNKVSGRTSRTTMRTGRAGAQRMRKSALQPQSHSSSVFIVVVLVVGLLLLVGAAFGLNSCMHKNADTGTQVAAGQKVTISIPEGAGGSDIAKLLVDAGVISDSSEFLSELMAQHVDANLKPGTYEFVTGEDISKVVDQLAVGPNTKENQVTIPEGVTVQKTAELVQEALGISADDFIAQAKASNYVSDYPFLSAAQSDSLEGFLYGKTYDFSGKTISADSVIRAMLDQYKSEVANLDFATAEATIKNRYGVSMSDYDILTLASIIEREAVTDDDRGKVASVFYNRLQKGMALQSDATMGYVTGGEVTADDLKTSSPYNTYLNQGLTPTPICSPSLKSIQAALAPDDTNYLYFFIVENGTYSNHSFSETYEQHQQAIEKAKADQAS